jgi:hypothetical protein
MMWKGNLSLSGIPARGKRLPNRYSWNKNEKVEREHQAREEAAKKRMPPDFGWNYGKPEND